MVARATTPETHWRSWETLASMPTWSIPAPPGRAVVVSPHPDDETFAVGGTIHRLHRLGWDLALVQVTDGEQGAGPGGTGRSLSMRRRREQRDALLLLGLSGMPVTRLRVPDTRVPEHDSHTVAALRPLLAHADLVLLPHPRDGHRDHDASGRAALQAAPARAALWAYLVWYWHWSAPTSPNVAWEHARRVPLGPLVRARKRAAMACYRSQVGSVVPAAALHHHRRPFEVLVGGWR